MMTTNRVSVSDTDKYLSDWLCPGFTNRQIETKEPVCLVLRNITVYNTGCLVFFFFPPECSTIFGVVTAFNVLVIYCSVASIRQSTAFPPFSCRRRWINSWRLLRGHKTKWSTQPRCRRLRSLIICFKRDLAKTASSTKHLSGRRRRQSEREQITRYQTLLYKAISHQGKETRELTSFPIRRQTSLKTLTFDGARFSTSVNGTRRHRLF